MPTIIKRGDRFLARVRRKGFSPVSQTFIRKTDAQAWGHRIEADMHAGRYVEVPASAPTLCDAIAEYRVKVAVRLKGARDYAYSFKELEASDICAKPLSGNYVYNLGRSLRGCFLMRSDSLGAIA